MKLHTTLVIEHGLDGRTDRNVTGNVVKVHEGDAVEQAERLAELQQVFGIEFDRGELTVENLRPVLWAAHWLKSVRPVAQRASELLTLAANRAFEPGSKAARDCDAVARVMASVATTEPHCLTAIEAARKIRVPADFYAARTKASDLGILGSAGYREQIIPMVRRGDGLAQIDDKIRARYLEESLATGYFDRVALSGLRADGIMPDGLLTADEPHDPGVKLTEQEVQAAFGAGSTVGADEIRTFAANADDSPFRLYGFTHEMHELLKLINVKVGGLHAVLNHGMEPSDLMQREADQALESIWALLARIEGRQPEQDEAWRREEHRELIDAACQYSQAFDDSKQLAGLLHRIDQSHTCELVDVDHAASTMTLRFHGESPHFGDHLWKLVAYTPSADCFGGGA